VVSGKASPRFFHEIATIGSLEDLVCGRLAEVGKLLTPARAPEMLPARQASHDEWPR
jgi:hypothetical protein